MKLKKILQKPSFKKLFGGLYQDEALKSAPKGFSNDHPHIDLLRNKSFAVEREITQKDVLHPDFNDLVLATYFEMLPFRRYLNEAAMI
ncbi:MAG: DUF2461 family protein [Bacteroidota bacterium]